MRVIAHCPKCDAGLPVIAAEAPESIKCGRCGHELALTFSDAIRSDARVDICPVCRGGDFYIRKDFDPKVGLTVVIVGALISAVFYWFGEDLIAYSILGGAALIDLVGLEDGRPLHQVPVPLWTVGGLDMTHNPVWIEPGAAGLRAYFMPEDDRSTLYIYDVR